MRGVLMYGPGDVRVADRGMPEITESIDAGLTCGNTAGWSRWRRPRCRWGTSTEASCSRSAPT
jgi:hypothetical protein